VRNDYDNYVIMLTIIMVVTMKMIIIMNVLLMIMKMIVDIDDVRYMYCDDR